MVNAAAAVSIAPVESPVLRMALRGMHLGAVLCAFATCGPTVAGCLLAGTIALHLLLVENARRELAATVTAVLYDGTGQWRVQWRDGARETARVAPGRLVSPWLTVLALDTTRGRIGLFVTPDILDDASFRRLRMRLLWQRPAAQRSDPRPLP